MYSFLHRGREFAPASIRLVLFRPRARDEASPRAKISMVAPPKRNKSRGPKPSLCRRRIVPQESRLRTPRNRLGDLRLRPRDAFLLFATAVLSAAPRI